MASVAFAANEAAGRQQAVSALHLEDLPVEILVEILCHLDFESFDQVLLVSRRLHSVFDAHWCSILSAILQREFSPAEGLLEVLHDVLLPETASRPQSLTAPPDCNCHRRSLLMLLWATGLHPVLNFCRVIKRWEAEFPPLLFFLMPKYSRSLRPHELCRLRQSLYVWWRFARRFHGPDARSDGNTFEGRRAFLRQCSTAQLRDVYDMWDKVRSAVRRQVCPSVSQVRYYGRGAVTEEEANHIGWGYGADNRDILDTMMKLPPDDMLHLLVYRHQYATKKSVIMFVKLRHPRIEDGIQTFTTAITSVLRERLVAFKPHFFLERCSPTYGGGILDSEDPRAEALRTVSSMDAGYTMHEPPHWIADCEVRIAGRAGRLWPDR